MTSKLAVSRENLEDLFAFESVLAEMSSRFVNLEPAEVDREIDDVSSRRGFELVEGILGLTPAEGTAFETG